ncbi:MAG: CBS domain-containing protein [Candidatus Cloacimonetes bacterium]|jgi:CBS domain-containing protein|nr:CBS domain-containing protein [Candidatus Cloacimonadota bacterium]
MKARDIMTSNPQCVTREDSLADAARIMRSADTGFVPVVDDRGSMRLSGVITDRDIAIRHVADNHPDRCTVGDHMSTGVRTVSPDDDVKDVMKLMKTEQVRRVPVVENERLVGVIAQADLATHHVGDKEVGETVEKISEPARR